MNSKNKWIVGLALVGTIVFGIVQLVIIPQQNKEREQYLATQLEATTQDVNFIIPYKNKYMGNASNLINLFRHLPLGTAQMKFQMFPDTYTVQINYNQTMAGVENECVKRKTEAESHSGLKSSKGEHNHLQKSLIYNSIAAFALIDNLEHIVYCFSDGSYQVDRMDIEALYPDFDTLLDGDNWRNYVQQNLKESGYVEETAKKIGVQKE